RLSRRLFQRPAGGGDRRSAGRTRTGRAAATGAEQGVVPVRRSRSGKPFGRPEDHDAHRCDQRAYRQEEVACLARGGDEHAAAAEVVGTGAAASGALTFVIVRLDRVRSSADAGIPPVLAGGATATSG